MCKIGTNFDYFDLDNHFASDDEDLVDLGLFLKKFKYDIKRKNKYEKRENYKGKYIFSLTIILSFHLLYSEYSNKIELDKTEEEDLKLLHNSEMFNRNMSILQDETSSLMEKVTI